MRPLHSLNKDYHTHHHHHHIDLHHHSPTPHHRLTSHAHNSATGAEFSLHHRRPTHSNLHHYHNHHNHHNRHHGHGLRYKKLKMTPLSLSHTHTHTHTHRHVKLHHEPQIETWEEVLELHRLGDKSGVKHPTETSSNPNIHGQVHHSHLKTHRSNIKETHYVNFA